MNTSNPLLSLCIPTFNRANYLKDALENITTDKAFDERVEVVISDNASTDNTEFIGRKYAKKFANIHYFKNEKNINDNNFFLALSRGKGKYLRLFNDTLRFKEGALKKMLDIIKSSHEDKPLFIYSNISFLNNENCKKETKTIEEFLQETSFYTTWIANFGCWNKHLNLIISPQKYSHLQLSQVDWTYAIVINSSQSVIYYDNFYIVKSINNKGGYNIYEVFVTNYFQLLRKYSFSNKVLNKEKYRLLKHFITPWFIKLNTDKNLTFKQNNKWNILFKEYWLHLYFYLFVIYWQIKKHTKIIKLSSR